MSLADIEYTDHTCTLANGGGTVTFQTTKDK